MYGEILFFMGFKYQKTKGNEMAGMEAHLKVFLIDNEKVYS